MESSSEAHNSQMFATNLEALFTRDKIYPDYLVLEIRILVQMGPSPISPEILFSNSNCCENVDANFRQIFLISLKFLHEMSAILKLSRTNLIKYSYYFNLRNFLF